MKMNQNELELRRNIYGQSGVIIISDDIEPIDVLKEIELIKSTMSLNGFIFRPSFAKTEDLTSFTDADYTAILCQYKLTYGF